MNKISKKIVALVTMAAFVLTLVPAAAFAASTDTTGYVVDANNSNTASQAAVTITLSDADLAEVNDQTNAGNVIVWAEDANGAIKNISEPSSNVEEWEGVKYLSGAAFSGNKATVNFANLAAGTYTFYVTVNTNANGYATDLADAKAKALPVQSAYVYGAADRDHSSYGVVENGAVVADATATTDKAFTTKFVVNDANDAGTTANLSSVKVWAEENGKPTNFVKFDNNQLGAENGVTYTDVNNSTEIKVTFTKAGTYTLHAGIGDSVTNAQKKQLQGTTTVTVSDQDVAIDNMKVSAKTSNNKIANISFDSTNTGKLDLTTVDKDFAYNGIDKVTLTGYAYDENGKPVAGKEITVSTNKDTVVEFDKTTVTTDNYGKFTVSFTMSDKSNADVTLANEEANLDYTIRVIAAKTSAQNIDRTKTGGYVLAGTDSQFTTDIVNDNFVNAVQFAITDQKGDAVTGPIDASEYTIDIRSRAKDGSTESTLEASDLALVWNEANGVYTLEYKGTATDAKTDLIPGKYEVRVALASDDNATVTFNAAKFGKTKDMTIDMEAANYADGQQKPTDGVHAITDEVTLGQFVAVKAYYVDTNGIKVPVTDTLQYGFDGKAVREVEANNGAFATAYDTPANESLLGTLIHVKVYNQANKQLVEKDLTVVDSYNTYSLEFDPTNGPINEDNKVAVKVVDEDGNVAKITNAATVSAYVADKSNADAKVSVEVADNAVTNGKGNITLYSDKETTADIVVVVKAGSAIYAGTLEYTFGTEDPLANRTVVMTIGSTDYVVNNKIVTGDAAPFVDSNWRTMVPIRALAESFDAEVNWDNDARTVTINYDANTQIVMTIGETTYTVNGEEKTMDTAPVIQGDRTYVPIRFAAQGMGFSVTPLYDSNNLTASVVFQK